MAWKILIAGAAAWFAAQFLKFLIDGLRARRFSPKMLVLPGKMPSAHTATIVAVTTMIYLIEGFSNLFALALFVSFIIIYDAVTSRRQVGIITKALNAAFRKKIRYFEGHTVIQAAVGIILGIAVACIVKWAS